MSWYGVAADSYASHLGGIARTVHNAVYKAAADDYTAHPCLHLHRRMGMIHEYNRSTYLARDQPLALTRDGNQHRS